MKARPYHEGDRARWNALARASRGAHFMFQREYMEYHADRFVDGSLVIEDEREKVLAIMPASRHGEELVSHGGLTFGGIQTTDRIGARKSIGIVRAVLEHSMLQGIATVRYKVMPHIYHAVPAEEDLYAVFRARGQLVRRDISSSIFLAARPGYSKGRKHVLKRVPADLVVERSEDYEAFMLVEAETLQHHGATATHTAAELALLADRFPNNVQLTVARLEDVIVAGAVTYDTPLVRHAQYIGATAAGKAMGASDAVINALIDESVGRFRWFDFGISTEEQGSYLNEGLVSNKESYGARGTVYDHYEIRCDKRALAGLG